MTTATDIQSILQRYKAGHRYFINLNLKKAKTLGHLNFATLYLKIAFSRLISRKRILPMQNLSAAT